MHTLRGSLLIYISILFILAIKPINVVFAACTPNPVIPAIGNKSIGANDCTIDFDTISGTDTVSTSNNTSVLTLDNAASHITINACGKLLAGSIYIDPAVTGSWISLQDPTVELCTDSGIAEGGKIKTNGPIYVTDADSDGYPVNLTLYDTTITGRRRFGLMTSITNLDCNDTNASMYANAVCYTDTDGDGIYSTSRTASVCGTSSTCPGASANPGTDCNDDANTVWRTSNCYPDFDKDTYTVAQTTVTCCTNGTSCETSTVRSACSNTATTYSHTTGQMVSAANGNDCNNQDGGAGVYASHAQCYTDNDRDTYTVGLAASTTCLNTASCATATKASDSTNGAAVTTYTAGQLRDSASGTNDCCDTDANAYPGSVYYGTVGVTGCTGGGGYDYDCDGNSNDKSESSTVWSCTNPCSGCSAQYAIVPGWQSGVPGCGASDNKVNTAEGYQGGTCYTESGCAAFDQISSLTMGCK
ncbi:MAG: hypothetical protein V1917_02230 [Candidatus Gottesmanbacteria bacterium]